MLDPRWRAFWEIAKREKPIAVAVDFSHAPSHALETADYIAKAIARDQNRSLGRVVGDLILQSSKGVERRIHE